MSGMRNIDARNIGLRNIVVADTRICSIDGEHGELIYRGYDILDLVTHSTFEETSYLLLFGDLPTKEELADFTLDLKENREIPQALYQNLKNRPITASPMDVLQSCISQFPDYDLDIQDDSREMNIKRAKMLISRIPTIVAVWDRIRSGKEIIKPSKEMTNAENFLYMLFGTKPNHEEAKIFDICLILHAEHSFNASTFAAREIASTKSHIYASINGATAALSGSLHGGANTQVMKMLLEIGKMENVNKWVIGKLERADKIMGMGHAVYKTTDPRAEVLYRLSKTVNKERRTPWFDMTEQVEKTTKKYLLETRKQSIYPNVDLYSASLYYSLGIPMDLFTPIFAIARISGWTSHVIEEKFAEAAPKPALYRPKAEYVGRYCGPLGCEYNPIDQRFTKIAEG
ncbi:MAG: citrate/2-methylcitrate synthase [Nitrososphaeraceae archaeon]|nr:citrate/2-methylcitrate synthase [Nitrososphaeraceae archaeon]MDW0143088.1 citrate/2-methylcitrate synthase [Nitrososphaeraceae archaeon]MDW0144743.1 citrate/2-methylcitrate synthase [Nitrososphaeraceae archaeon]MDW0148071.1 citrate/2-methylcitrate synthase [Nitrososphaeraceae archaeon]MDW3654437.1 citrate/2-methylcitrate synthase [Nitrososphaeraceae archaeon]